MKYRKNNLNDRGVLDIPFKIIIMIILVGSVIPFGMMSYLNISREKYENKIKNELEKIFLTAEKVSLMGNLSARKIEIDLECNFFEDIEFVKIKNTSSDRTIIKYKLSWKDNPNYISSYDINITSKQNKSLFLRSKTYDLTLTHIEYPRKSYVILSKK